MVGCDCGPATRGQLFACAIDDECSSEFVCVDGECVRAGPAPLDAGPVDAGRTDAGPVDAGKIDAGPADAGPVDAGPVDAGAVDAGPFDAGAPDAGSVDAGPPTRLFFTTETQVVAAGACSRVAMLETRSASGLPSPVAASTVVNLSTNPVGALAYFQNDLCSGAPSATLTLAAGASTAQFYFRGTTPGTPAITASATGLTAASQSETIIAGPPAALVFTTPARTLLAGACSPASGVELRDSSGNATTAAAPTPVTLAELPPGSARFFSDSACSTAGSTGAIDAGAGSAAFYFKGISGGVTSLGATAGALPAATQNQTIISAARAGSCAISDGATSATCPIVPAQTQVGKTMLVFQAGTNNPDPSSAAVRCGLTSVSTITCNRMMATGIATVLWQTLELPTGLKVQHLTPACNGMTVVTVPIAAVANAAETFLLTSFEAGGSAFGNDDLGTIRLASPTSVEIRFASACQADWRASLQVVELTGISVTRGVTGAMTGASLSVTGLGAVNLGSSALLLSHRMIANTSAICDRMIRGQLSDATSLTFSRGNGAGGCTTPQVDAISWERIDFGTRAQVTVLNPILAVGATTTSLTIPAVDRTRSIIFASGQTTNGQGSGEGSYSGNDTIGELISLYAFGSSTSVTVSRASALGSARFSSYVVELNP